MRAAGIAFLLCLVAVPANAQQPSAPSPVGAAERAEHEQWEIDSARWTTQHIATAAILDALAERVRSSENALARYSDAVREHEARLDGHAEEGTATLAAHMQMRSAHETMRIRHAALREAVEALQRAVGDDDDDGGARQ